MKSLNWLLCGLVSTALTTATVAQAAESIEMGIVSRAVPEQTDWRVRIPATEKAVFRGLDGANASIMPAVGMMYPGPFPLFLAGILAHGLVSSSMQNSRAAQQQAEADKVLLPYRGILDLIGERQLVELAAPLSRRGKVVQIIGSTEPAAGNWVIDMAPVFSLVQDERALVMDSVVAVYAPDKPQEPIYKTMVRVVSQPVPANVARYERVTLWTSTEGRMLRQVGAGLISEALDVVQAELARGPEASATTVYKTVRYALGGSELMERATLVSERCDRLVLKTLRGGLLSVPRQMEVDASICDSGGAAPPVSPPAQAPDSGPPTAQRAAT